MRGWSLGIAAANFLILRSAFDVFYLSQSYAFIKRYTIFQIKPNRGIELIANVRIHTYTRKSTYFLFFYSLLIIPLISTWKIQFGIRKSTSLTSQRHRKIQVVGNGSAAEPTNNASVRKFVCPQLGRAFWSQPSLLRNYTRAHYEKI